MGLGQVVPGLHRPVVISMKEFRTTATTQQLDYKRLRALRTRKPVFGMTNALNWFSPP